MSAAEPQLDTPLFTAAIELLHRTGADGFQLRFSDDEQPVVWIAVGAWFVNDQGKPCPPSEATSERKHHEAAASLDPLTALIRLLERVLDGAGRCLHCGRPTGVNADFAEAMPLTDQVCWYTFDPELATFRRSCEGETGPQPGRNDPCWCGHGA